MKRFIRLAALPLSLALAAGCNGGMVATPTQALGSMAELRGASVGAGKIVATKDGGQIYGYDVDQGGRDGVLASARIISTSSYKVSVETFDTKMAKITKSFAVYTGPRNSYQVDGIFDHDVALVTHFIIPKGTIYAKRRYDVMNPVTAEKFTGHFTPTVKDLSVLQNAENQSTSTSVVYAIELKNNDNPDLVVSDFSKKEAGNVIHLNPTVFAPYTEPQLSQDTANNQAVMTTSPDGGAAGGPPPNIETIDLSSGKESSFDGADCPGSEGCGSPNGIAYDSNTGIACTDTQLDAGVEIYDVAKKSGFWAGHLPVPTGGIGEFYTGGYIANDPIHKLFLIAQPNSGSSPTGSSIQVYDENGNFVESVNGLNFTFNFYLAIPVKIAIDPETRTGWTNSPTMNELQEFSY